MKALIKFLKLLKKWLFKLKMYIQWWSQYYAQKHKYLHCLKKSQRKVEKLNIESILNALIIVPHADDELIGCFSVINNVTNVYCYYIGEYKPYDSNVTKKRDQELLRFARDYGFHVIIGRNMNHVNSIRTLLREKKIDVVFTPGFLDWHPDHQAASKYLLDALKTLDTTPMILCYNVSVPAPFERNTYYVPLDSYLHCEKWMAFDKYYYSQRFMPTKRFILHEKLNSVGIQGVEAAEVFSLVSLKDLTIQSLNKPDMVMRKFLHRNINNIVKIRNIVDNYQ